MRTLQYIALALFVFISLPASADDIRQSMTIKQAYDSIPHEWTRFDASVATMDAAESRFLSSFFGITDLAAVERITHQLRTNDVDNYAAILKRIGALNPPENLRQVQQLIYEVVVEQRDYLYTIRAGSQFNASDPLVQSSHAKLIAIYNELMGAYPSESAHNKKAFYDHLCALDFI